MEQLTRTLSINAGQGTAKPPRKLRHRDASMRFGVFWPYSRTLIPSATIASRNPDVLDVNNHIALARAAEAIGMDFALVADGYSPASAEKFKSRLPRSVHQRHHPRRAATDGDFTARHELLKGAYPCDRREWFVEIRLA